MLLYLLYDVKELTPKYLGGIVGLGRGELALEILVVVLGVGEAYVHRDAHSYHMKILIDAGVVNSQRNGLWTRYSINEATFADILDILPQLYKTKDECICAQIKYCRISEHEKEA